MFRRTIGFILIMSAVIHSNGQDYSRLDSIRLKSGQIHFSKGYDLRAKTIALRIENAYDYYSRLLESSPRVNVLLLTAEDWKTHTTMGAVYGMPHYNSANHTLVLAATDNPFWKSFVPPLDQLPGDLRKQVEKAYRTANGEISMQAFFDLLALHELGHSFHMQEKVFMQRQWMSEWWVNILLHTYVAEKEPEQLPALMLFPQMMIDRGAGSFEYTRLQQLDSQYNQIARFHPNNYGWYQCRWHAGSVAVYEKDGKQAGRRLWDIFLMNNKRMTEEELLKAFEEEGLKELASLISNWDKDTKL